MRIEIDMDIDIDGVLTNDDDFILDYGTKFCYENNIEFYNNPYLYETRKFASPEEILQQYRDEYFEKYVNDEPPRKFVSEVIKKIERRGKSNLYYYIKTFNFFRY